MRDPDWSGRSKVEWCCIKVAILQIVAVLLFLWGFLLAKVELVETSSASCGPLVPLQSEPAFDKTVLVVIDGLRFDFTTAENSNCSQSSELKVPVLQDLRCQLVSPCDITIQLRISK